MKKILSLTMLLVLFSWHNAFASLEAFVKRTQIPLGEAFTLTLKSDKNETASPDLSVLSNDFRVYSTSVSRQSRIINGQSENSTEWRIGLIALNSDVKEIPAISVGNQTSEPIKIEIISQAQSEHQDNNPIAPTYAMSAKIINPQNKWYVQQQITYEVTIRDGGELQGGEPTFSGESTQDWLIKSLGQPAVSSVVENNQRVRLIKFKYALFPQKSGELKIPAVQFNGYSLQEDNSGGFGIFSNNIGFSINIPSMFGVQTPVSLQAPEQNITILPAPQNYGGNWWLPAENLTLTANWGNNPQFMVGEATTREIILRATGVVDSQLPQMKFAQSEEIKQYPEKSRAQSLLENGKIVSVQKTTNVYIPEKSGVVKVPEIAIEWFNINTGKLEKAIIPAEQITVKKNPQIIEETQPLPEPEENIKEVENKSNTLPTFNPYALAVMAFALGILFSFFLFRHRGEKEEKPRCELRKYPEYIIAKAHQNDFRSTRDALISWATAFYPDKSITNLKDLAEAADYPPFSEQIEVLIAKLYNPKDESIWNPKVFTDSFRAVLKKSKKGKQKSPPLPNLYE